MLRFLLVFAFHWALFAAWSPVLLLRRSPRLANEEEINRPVPDRTGGEGRGEATMRPNSLALFDCSELGFYSPSLTS